MISSLGIVSNGMIFLAILKFNESSLECSKLCIYTNEFNQALLTEKCVKLLSVLIRPVELTKLILCN